METTEKKLEAEVAIYQSIFSHSPDLAYLIDKNCSFLACNDNFLQHLGLPAIEEKAVGTLYRYMKGSGFWREQQLQNMKQKDIETILSGVQVKEPSELPLEHKDGRLYFYQVTRTPIFDAEKKVTALLVQLKDITVAKRMQEQMDKIKKELAKFNADKTLPIHKATQTEALRILIVEDNITAQKAAQAILMQVDCTVDVADSEPQLTDLFKPGKYDLVLMDIGLEETSGYMLARYIRVQEEGSGNHVPIIALTSYNAELLTRDCQHYSMEGAITKPLTLEQARQLIQHYIYQIEVPISGLKLAGP